MSIERVLTVLGNKATRPITDFLLTTRGNETVYYADSVNGDNGRSGKSPETAVASIAYVVDSLASAGDIIVALAGHVETVIAAGGLDLDLAGLTVLFLGEGSSKAYITFTTDVAADMDIDAASITLINPKFVAGIDALTGPIDVNATDFKIIDGEWHDAAGIETTDCIVATSGATRLCIDGWKFFKSDEAGTQKESHIQLNGVDDAILKRLHIEGDFDTAIIENVTDEVLRITMEDHYLKNTDPGNAPCASLDANASGWGRRLDWRNANGTVTDNVALINWSSDALGYGTDGYGGDPIGTGVAGGLEGKIDVIDGYHDVATADAATNAVMSDVIGNKTDAAVNAATTDKTITAYVKGVLNEIAVPAQNNTDNAFINDVIGQKTDAEAAGAVTTTDTLVGYTKQLVTAAIAEAAQTLKLDGATLSATPTANSLATFVASGGTALGQTLPASTSIVDIVGNFTGPYNGAAQDDNIKASLDLAHTDIDAILLDTGTTLPATLAAVPQCVVKADGACINGLDPLFTIAGGPVRCKIVGLVTTTIGSNAANFRLQHITTTPAATVELNVGAVAVTDDAAGTFYYNVGASSTFTPSTGLGFMLLDPVTVEETEFLLAPGVVQCLGTADNTGVIAWYMTYEPLSPLSTVAAAA